MIKKIFVLRLMPICFLAMVLSGCAIIIKDDRITKYYGIDQQRGREYLNQILEKQQQVYQVKQASVSSKRQ